MRVLEMRRRGLSGVEIAQLIGITHQAVYQHIGALVKAGLLPKKNGRAS